MDYETLIDTKDSILLKMEVEGARLKVAEDIGWLFAIAIGVIVYLRWDSWIAMIVAIFASFYAITYTYRDKFAKARAAYMSERFPAC